MNLDTRDRILNSATTLFADHGYRGASVRRICDLARANPGAISYHFGGKRQLYRTVLRRAAAALADLRIDNRDPDDLSPAPAIFDLLDRLVDRMSHRTTEIRLLLRDLADGGEVAVEALEPSLREAHQNLRVLTGNEEGGGSPSPSRDLFVDLAAPLVLLTAGWPVLRRALDLGAEQQQPALVSACRRALAAHGLDDRG